MLSVFRRGVLAFAVALAGVTWAGSAASARQTDDVADSDPLRKSVVKIHTKVRRPDLYRPWTSRSPHEASGSGVVIDGQRILTNAHVVTHANEVLVESELLRRKIPAKVEAIAVGVDLAILSVSEPDFFTDHPAVAFSDRRAREKDTVQIYGFPMGGSTMSITKGVVSRVEYERFYFGERGLRIQVDAAANPGNSGGPAFTDDRAIGLVFSGIREADNIAYLISVDEIRLFLDDVADGRYDGKPRFLDTFATVENQAMRRYLKLPAAVNGMVVVRPASTDAAHPLRRWDVLTHVGTYELDERGFVEVEPGWFVYAMFLVQRLAADGAAPVKIRRDGVEMAIDVPAPRREPALMPSLEGGYPSYFVHGPAVFTAVSAELGRLVEAPNWAQRFMYQGSPLVTRYHCGPEFEGEQLVALSSNMLPHPLSRGYDTTTGQVVKSVNGVTIKNLRHLIETIRECKDEFLVIEFHDRYSEPLVFDRAEIAASTEEILDENGIRNRVSPDLRDIELP